jgi:hypothetical protein
MVHQIEIKVPIWKTRSIGISLTNCSPEDDIEIEIAFKNKDGVQLWPHIYELKAKEIYAYGIKYTRKGVDLYDVPIRDLRVKKASNGPEVNYKPSINNSINQNQLTMLFDNKEIEKIRKENSERGGSNKKKIEKGEQVLTMIAAEIAYSKKDKNPMIKVDFSKSEDYRPVSEYYMLAGGGSEFGKSKMLAMLENGYGYIMQAAKDEKEVLKQVKKFIGKNVKVAIKYESSLYDTDKNGTVIAHKPMLWYFGNANDSSFRVDINKCESPLSKDDMERVMRLAEAGVEVKDAKGHAIIAAVLKNDSGNANEEALFSGDIPTQIQSEDDDGLPF